MPINPVLLADRLEAIRNIAHRLGGPKKENTVLVQREMEKRQNLALRLRAQIDEQIAAGDEIEAGERRVGQQALAGEHHRLTQFAHDPIAVVLFGEEASESRRRHVSLDRFGIDAVAGERYAIRVDVGGEHLQLDIAFCGSDMLEKEHRDRISFFARAAARHPNAQRSIQCLPLHELRNDLLPQQLKGDRIAEEVRDVDEEVLGKEFALAGILTQDLQIAIAVLDARHGHASLDPALQRALLVE